MHAIAHQDTFALSLTNQGLHAQTLLAANEERITALHHTLKQLESERHALCGRLQGNLTANEINWLFRPAVPLQENRTYC